MSNSNKLKKGGNEPWRAKERHYCSVCNAWMGSDRQSIALHENGKKHLAAVETDLIERREEKKRKERDREELESVFRKVEEAAAVASGCAVGAGTGGSTDCFSSGDTFGTAIGMGAAAPLQGALQRDVWSRTSAEAQKQQGQWRDRQPSQNGGKVYTRSDATTTAPTAVTGKQQPNSSHQQKRRHPPKGSHYEQDGITYLEGSAYFRLLEPEFPIQLWTGDPNAATEDMRDLRSFNFWKNALVVNVAKPVTAKLDENKEGGVRCRVSYLRSVEDDDETVETGVLPHRIRLVLGGDGVFPQTLEEARLVQIGGEETIQVGNGDATAEIKGEEEVDENTGLTMWKTTTIKRVTAQHLETQERKRKRQEKHEAEERERNKERETRARRMEEAKWENAHDSALGAYHVWSSTGAGGGGEDNHAGGAENPNSAAAVPAGATYKGIDITKELKVEVADTAKRLAKGKGGSAVGFKKKKGKKTFRGRRTTSADDD